MAGEKNILGDMTENIGENLKEKLSGQLSPEHLLSEGNLKKRRSAFWTCLIAGLLLMALALGVAVYGSAIKVDIFESQLLEKVDYAALGTDELSIRSFARETIFYLTGAQETWNPQIVIGGFPASSFIPQSFRDHMETVKGWFGSARAVFLAGLGIALVLLGRALIGTGKKGSFSLGGYYLGAGAALAVMAGLGLWGYFNFDSLWQVVHQTLIPDGIFSAAEPVMKLFPVELFAAYLQPIAVTFGILAAIVLALPLILFPLSRLLTSLLGKKGGNARKPSSGTRTKKKPTKSAAKKKPTKSATKSAGSGR